MATLAPAKWHGGVLEKVVVAVILAALAFAWSAGATAVDRLGKVPGLEVKVDKHDAEIADIKKAQEIEAKGRHRLIELLEAAVDREKRKRSTSTGGR